MQEGAVVPKPLRLLDSGDIQVIHSAVLQVLSKLGVVYEAQWTLDLLNEMGCDVDYSSKRVKIPEHVVDEAIKKSPRIVKLCGRNSKYDLKFEGTRVYFAGGANAVRIVDYDKNRFTVRGATAKDLVDLTILTDALENIHCYLPPVYPQDVPPKGVDRLKCEIALNYTEKPLYHDSEGYQGALDQIRMASLVVGDEERLRKRPIIALAPCITSPLSWSESALGTLKACAEKGVPSIISSEPIAGATAPVTLAGSLMEQCAEILSGLVVAHSLNPGTPTIACSLPSVMDMRTANIVLSSIETGMMSAGAAQVFREFYGMPYVGGGCISDSKIPDQQAGYEKALTVLYGALAGINLVHLASGMLDFVLSESAEQIVIDNEILGMVMHGLKQIEVSETSVALDALMQVGPRGQFLSSKHTKANVRRELFMPSLSDRLSRESWNTAGAQDIVGRANCRVEEIIRTHAVPPLASDVRESLSEITRKAQSAP